MTAERDRRHAEETIVPVERPIAGREPRRLEPAERAPRIHLAGVAAGILLLLVLAVFFVLPRWVEQRQAAAALEAPAVAEPEAPPVPTLSAEQLAALESEAEDLLAELLEQQDSLAERSAEAWGGQRWLDYVAQAETGDDAFLADDFEAAVTSYRAALATGTELLAQSEQIMEAAFAAGDAAFAAGNAALAQEQFGIVLGVDPGNARALRGKERAARLPEVLDLVRRGDSLRQESRLQEAAAAYREALAIDADWEPARRSLGEVETAIANAGFDRSLSAGFAALAAEDFDEAESAFRQALALRPSSEAARDGLEQAEQGLLLDAIALAEIRALAFERRELWDQAIERYEAALAADPTLAFAIEGLERSQARADLDRKLENLIDNPNLLLNPELLDDAEGLLADARPYVPDGQRIAEQVARLEALVNAVKTPVTVRLESDELTDVTVYRVGKLGAFASMELDLRPGTYTVIGSRNGYRDVRTTITVLPGRTIEPVSVVCSEPI